MFKGIRVFIFVFVLLSIFAGTANAYDRLFKEVYVIDDGEKTRYRTTSETVGEFFNQEKIVLNEKDKVNRGHDAQLYTGLEIVIQRGITVVANVDGLARIVKVTKDTRVGNLIVELPAVDGIEYVYDGLYSTALKDGETVKLSVKKVVKETTTETISYTSTTEENPELLVGTTEVHVVGVEGLKELNYDVTLVSEKEVSRKLVGEKIAVAPVNEIIHVGTKPEPKPEPPAPTPSKSAYVAADVENLQYTRVIQMEATAYTNSFQDTGKNPGDKYYGITASGMKARYGVVAVDPRVIPLGTNLYVVGYGYAIAGDTGGAIKGNKIDLFFDTRQECYTFGRRQITVYVLD